MRLVALVLVVIAGACQDPSLSVDVNHPGESRIEDALRETTVSIYESDGLTCEQVELGDLSAGQLEALLSAKVTIVKGVGTTGTFSGVSRLAHKVVVARGFAEKGALLTAQCAELDEIDDGTSVKLKTEVAAKVSIGVDDDTGGILVTTTEPLPGSKSINGRKVSWRLFGPSGSSADGAKLTNVSSGVWEPKTPTCTKGGEAIIHPVPPKIPGGYALRLRVAWATEPPPLFTQLTTLPHAVQNLPGTPATVLRPCAVRRSGGTAGVVCVTDPTTATELRLSGSSLVAGPTATLSASLPDPVIGVVSIDLHDAADTRDVYAITTRGNWQALFGAPSANGGPNSNWWCPGGGCTTLDLQVVPACAGEPTPGFLIGKIGTVAGPVLRKMPLRGGTFDVLGQAGDGIANAGCLTERINRTDGTTSARQRQAIALSRTGTGGNAAGAVVFECSASTSPCVIPTLTDGVGFAPEVPARMIVGTFDASGTVLSSVDARPNEVEGTGATRDRLIELSRQPAAAPPDQLITGNFDDDKQLDLLWHFSTRATGNVQIAYAREVDGTPITALAAYSGQPIEELLSGDLDGNGIDEIIAVLAVLAPNPRKLDVIPMGVAYPPSPIVDDPPCP